MTRIDVKKRSDNTYQTRKTVQVTMETISFGCKTAKTVITNTHLPFSMFVQKNQAQRSTTVPSFQMTLKLKLVLSSALFHLVAKGPKFFRLACPNFN